MVRTVKIENFKSISKLEFELGRFNVFIGENGSGKSNLLEAFAMAGMGEQITLSAETLYAKGIRVTKPNLTYSSFKGVELGTEISMAFDFELDGNIIHFPINLTAESPDKIEAEWGYSKLHNISSEMEEVKEQLELTQRQVKELSAKVSEIQEESSIEDKKSTFSELIEHLSAVVNQFNGIRTKRASYSLVLQDLKNALPAISYFKDFVIYTLNIPSLRGIFKDSLTQPLGIHGENLDVHIAQLSPEEREQLKNYYKYIQWLGDVEVDIEDRHKTEGYKLGKSTSQLFFVDRFLKESNNLMSAESANEGVLFMLFYLVLFLSPQTPRFFAIDNIEQALNPRLARELIKELARLSKEKNKQALITTHDPAILDGLNLYDDEQRLFVVSRADDGATTVNRVKLNGESKRDFKLSEMWMRGSLGAVPTTF